MQSKLLHQVDGQKTFALIFETGDEVLSTLKDFARKEKLSAAQFTAVGAFSEVVLGYFDWEKKEYLRKSVAEQFEVASLIGDVALAPEGSLVSISTLCWGAAIPVPWLAICSRAGCVSPSNSCLPSRPRTFASDTIPRAA